MVGENTTRWLMLDGYRMGNDTFDNSTSDLAIKNPAIGILLSVFSFITISGNILVIVAVFKEFYLRTVTNYFLVSLAVADMMVGGVVMPFSISHEMTNQVWLYGEAWCDLWHSIDVLASTASILNLCIISLDRYWAITDPIAYPSKMSACKVCLLISFVWLCSAGISFPAIAWWKAVTPPDLSKHECVFTEDSAYLIFSSLVSFYAPTMVMMFVYFRIYVAAAEQTKALKEGSKTTSNGLADGEVMTLRIHRGCSRRPAAFEELTHVDRSASDSESDSPSHMLHRSMNRDSTTTERNPKFITKRLRSFALSKKLTKLAREQKAAKTLGIVVGVFILCWLPFFVTNVLYGLCHGGCVKYPDTLMPIFTWLGYLNSGMNPIIYALSMRDFRRAFGKILCLCCPKYRFRNTHKNYYHNSMSTSSFSVNWNDRCIQMKT